MITGVNLLRINRPGSPFDHLGVVFMLRIGGGLKELGIAPRAVSVLGQAASRSVNQDQVYQAGADMWRTSVIALKLGLATFIVPYLF